MKKAATMPLPTMLVVLSLVRALPADVFHMPTGLTSLETVAIGDPGNKADDTGFGAGGWHWLCQCSREHARC